MSPIILILIILICVVLSFFVLIQNPKGGGMAGTFGGFGNSVMGAKQSNDAVEKGTWYTMLALTLVVLASFVMMPKSKNAAAGNEAGDPLKASTQQMQAPTAPPAQTAPAQTAPAQTAPATTAPATTAPATGDATVPADE